MWWQESPGLVQEDAVQELKIKAGRLERENEALKNEMAPMQKEITSIKDEKATLEDESSTVAKHVSSSQVRPEGATFGYQRRRASVGVYGQDLLQRQRD
jgi:predicted  nucleic acid-binding Zn-ribbon protein